LGILLNLGPSYTLSTYPFPSVFTAAGVRQPIRVAPRQKGRRRPNRYKPKPTLPASKPAPIRLPPHSTEPNVLLDDRGHPDQTSDYDWLETSQQAPPFVRKTRPLPDEIDPSFDVKFNEAIHGEYLRTNLKTDHLPSGIAQQLTDLIKKYWCVFDPEGVGKTIIGYECSIDTGDAKPIACKNINYGPRESAVIMQHLTVLEKIRHIEQIYGSEWLFKIILAPKPHQEHIYDIADDLFFSQQGGGKANPDTLILAS
jgi:hypothetical protein